MRYALRGFVGPNSRRWLFLAKWCEKFAFRVKSLFNSHDFQPKVKMDVNTRGNPIAEGVHEIVLTLTITAKVEEDTAYIVELQQAGIFAINGFPEEQMAHVLGAVCPNFLFPYAREAVDSIVVKGGFPPLSIAPIDFDAIFRQSQASADQSGQSLN